MTHSKKKILYISHDSKIGGATNVLYTLLRQIDKEKFVPEVIFPEEGPMVDLVRGLNIHTIIFPLKWWIADRESYFYESSKVLIERSKKLASIIEAEKIDVVHTNTSVVIEGALAARITGRPHIWHIHEILYNHPTLTPYLPLYLAGMMIDLLSDIIVAVSERARKSLVGIDPSRVKVIYNGIDIKSFDENKSIRYEIGIPATTYIISTISGILKEKGYDLLIETAALILSRRKDIVFLAVGAKQKSYLYEELIKKIHELNIDNNFHFLGFRNDISDIIRETDIVVVPSITESFSLSAVEAMSHEKPVVATACGGVEEIVIDGETGIIVPVNSPHKMADAILNLLVDEEKRQIMGKKAKQRVQEFYLAERYVREFEELYKTIGRRRLLPTHDNLILDSLIDVFCEMQSFKSKEAHMNAILNSRSWKITALLRWLNGILINWKKGIW